MNDISCHIGRAYCIKNELPKLLTRNLSKINGPQTNVVRWCHVVITCVVNSVDVI